MLPEAAIPFVEPEIASGAIVPGAALNATSVPGLGSTSASPPASGAPEMAKGLRRAASSMTMLAFNLSVASGLM